MPRASQPMSADLLRQRRNIITISCIMIFLKYSDVDINNFSIFGLNFSNFENPQAVFLALWITWFYFALRYYQYFTQEGLPRLLSVLMGECDLKCAPKIKTLVRSAHPNEFKESCGLYVLNKCDWTYHGQEKTGQNEFGEETIGNFKMKISPILLWREFAVAAFITIVNRSVVTDYILPLILAIFTLIYCLFAWDGSLIVVTKGLIT